MSQLGQWFEGELLYNPALSVTETALGILLAFVLSQVTAWVYVYTHHGLSYSRAFVQSIILLSVIMTIGVMVIGNHVAIAFGLVGALSVIRFRNILKDTRDTAFVFFALILSMACGTHNYLLSLMGTGAFCGLALYLHWAQFGSRHVGDGFLRFEWDTRATRRAEWQPILVRYCRTTKLVSHRFQEGGPGEASYRLSMRNPDLADRLVDDLRALSGIENVTFMLQEEEVEV